MRHFQRPGATRPPLTGRPIPHGARKRHDTMTETYLGQSDEEATISPNALHLDAERDARRARARAIAASTVALRLRPSAIDAERKAAAAIRWERAA
jgi:hypothetical protein